MTLAPPSHPPSVPPQRNPAAPVEHHLLRLQQETLPQLVAKDGTPADLPTGVDHPVPGDRGRRRERVQRVAHLPRMARKPGEDRDLAVAGHPAPGDPVDHGVDARVGWTDPGTSQWRLPG